MNPSVKIVDAFTDRPLGGSEFAVMLHEVGKARDEVVFELGVGSTAACNGGRLAGQAQIEQVSMVDRESRSYTRSRRNDESQPSPTVQDGYAAVLSPSTGAVPAATPRCGATGKRRLSRRMGCS